MTGARRKNGRQDGNTRTERTPMGAVAMVLGRRQVTVSGCRRIIEYGAVRVRLAIEGGELIIEGRGLTVYTYCGDELVIRGVLEGVKFAESLGSQIALPRENPAEVKHRPPHEGLK